MTLVQPFARTLTSRPTPTERRAEILAQPGFGRYFTDHMVTITWDADRGWHDAAVEPYHTIELDPAASVLHYGQAIFEGLKAYRGADGTRMFRPMDNVRRMNVSAERRYDSRSIGRGMLDGWRCTSRKRPGAPSAATSSS